MNPLLEQVERAITHRHLISKGESLLVAVSGGVDSMVLLHLLTSMAPRHRWSLTVAHLNHQLRGRSSQADEALVRKTARQLKLKCVVNHADIRRLARQKKKSIEMAAREARHRFLARTAKRVGAAKIVLAHHANDQVELFFLRLFRGSGSEGLAGMKWSGPSPENPEITLVRPLLEIPKAALAEYAREQSIPFREDATNARVDIPRNRIRHELLPLLRGRFQPGLDKVLARTLDILSAESDFAQQTARDWLADKTEMRFLELPVAVQRKVLQIQLLNQGVVPDFEQLEILRLNPGTVVELGLQARLGRAKKAKSVRMLVNQEGKLWTAPPACIPFSQSSVALSLPATDSGTSAKGRISSSLRMAAGNNMRRPQNRAPCRVAGNVKPLGTVEFEGISISWEISQSVPKTTPKPLAGREIFDADQIGSRVLLRHWRPGDRFQPIGMKNAVKLQDYFVNAKVPRAERHRLLVAVSESGEVFWVEGLRISERFKLTPATTRSLQWMWKRL